MGIQCLRWHSSPLTWQQFTRFRNIPYSSKWNALRNRFGSSMTWVRVDDMCNITE